MKARVTDAVDDERFLPRVRRRLAQEIETDQEIAAQPDAFPSDEQQQQIVRQDQRQHREHEQIQVAEEAVVAAFVRHVAGRIHVNQESDAGDDEQHHAVSGSIRTPHGTWKSHHASGIRVHDSGGNPVKQVVADQAFRDGPRNELPDRAKGIAHRQKNAADANDIHRRIREPAPDEQHQRRARQGKQRDQPDMRKKIFRRHHELALIRVFFRPYLCHSERSEESLALSQRQRDSSLRSE